MLNAEPDQIVKQSLMEQLKSMQLQKQDGDLIINSAHRRGTIYVREGAVLAAHCGMLHGNGAILTLAQMTEPRLELVQAAGAVQKTVFISLEQIERFLASQKAPPSKNGYCDEEQLLQQAKNLFFRFRYKEASEKFVTILRQNRFFYPAWLWQSRLLTRQDYIARALDEAYRWGNHDQEVWREARKMRPQLSDLDTQVHRCMFCWSILTRGTSCDHCKAQLAITAKPLPADIHHDDIRLALSSFTSAFRDDTANARTAFALALGNFNLNDHLNALEYMRLAAKNAPQTPLYSNSLSLLETIARTRASQVQTGHKPDPGTNPTETSILIVEDSITSRKVLSMLFSRFGCRLLEAGSGAEAIQAARNNRPRLILLDVMLPDTNGHYLLTQLRDIPHLRDVPVIMLTGRHDANDRLKGVQAGACEYITKPFNPQKLTALVEGYLRNTKATAASPSPDGPPAQQYSPVKVTATAKVEAVPNSPAPAAAAVPARNGNKSILIIEDSRTSRKVLSMILGRNGYHVYEASSGQDALNLAQSIRPDLVLLDVMLPDMTGYDVLPQLKRVAHFTDLPVIMLTGNRKATDRMQGLLAGSNEYVTKPFDPQKLLAIIGGYI